MVISYVLGESPGERGETSGRGWVRTDLGACLRLLLLVLAVFLWPLISSHDATLWLEPVLQKLDFGVLKALQKITENHSE